jgi:putative hydrolase of the HAD superfamily
MKSTVLFDLGGTLARYYERAQFPQVLRKSILEVQLCLRRAGLPNAAARGIWARVEQENHEAEDHRVRPLEERLARIFQLNGRAVPDALMERMCRSFMKSIFALGQCYEDSLPALRSLRAAGKRTAIISNTSWGSPAALWREETQRLGLAELVDAAVFCRDVGWRKPDRRIFEFALDRLAVGPDRCIFVGDDPRWDVAGATVAGIEPVLIDRTGAAEPCGCRVVRSLLELP